MIDLLRSDTRNQWTISLRSGPGTAERGIKEDKYLTNTVHLPDAAFQG